MNKLEQQFGKLTDDEKELLYCVFHMDPITQARFIGKLESASEIYAQLAEMFSVKPAE